MQTEDFYKPSSRPPLLSVQGFKDLDQFATKNFLPECILVENAGRTLAAEAFKRFKDAVRSKPSPVDIVAVVGSGNNAADSLVAARYLHELGISIVIMTIVGGSEGSAEFLRNLEILKKMGVSIEVFVKERLTNFQPVVIIDGLFGTGFQGKLTKTEYVEVIEAINQSPAVVVSADIPSGQLADRDDFDIAVKADVTVSFSGMKYSFITHNGSANAGRVVCYDIGIPEVYYKEASKEQPRFKVFQTPHSWDKDFSSYSHKYDRGHVLVFGGSEGKFGAAALCTRAALQAGAGWVSVAASVSKVKSQKICLSESDEGAPESFGVTVVMEHLLEDNGAIDIDALIHLTKSRHVRSLVFGPGWTQNFLNAGVMGFLQGFCKSGGFVVFDAGATHGLIPLIEKYPLPPERAIALPHPGEWAKLGGALSQYKMESAAELYDAAGAIKKLSGLSLVWKSATPIFFAPHLEENLINVFPTNQLARAGMGDVLAGLTAGACAKINDVVLSASTAHAAMVLACEAIHVKKIENVSPETIIKNIFGYV